MLMLILPNPIGDITLDTLFTVCGFILTIVGLIAGGSFLVSRPVLRSSNAVLREALADYKEAIIVTEKQKNDLAEALASAEAAFKATKKREAELNEVIAAITLENVKIKQENAMIKQRLSELEAQFGTKKP